MPDDVEKQIDAVLETAVQGGIALGSNPKGDFSNERNYILKRNHTINQAKAELLRIVTEAQVRELETLQKLHTRTYRQIVTDNTGAVYIDDTHSYISKYEAQERIAELKQSVTPTVTSTPVSNSDNRNNESKETVT